jgi:hypothetical protein
MTVQEMLDLLDKAQLEGRLLLRDEAANSRTRVVKSVSIRCDDTGQIFVILHDGRAGEFADVQANPEG